MQQTLPQRQTRIKTQLGGNDDVEWTDVPRTDIVEKLVANIDIDDETGCWLWTGAAMDSGYARVRVGDSIPLVHRLVFRLVHGEIPDGKQINHTCHVRNCVNSEHLYAGDQAQNVRDAIRRGAFHEGTSSLTADDVRGIRRKYESGSVSQSDLAAEYGVSESTINRVVNHESWTHID